MSVPLCFISFSCSTEQNKLSLCYGYSRSLRTNQISIIVNPYISNLNNIIRSTLSTISTVAHPLIFLN
jgi:hypothetical protein